MKTTIYKCDRCGAESTVINDLKGESFDTVTVNWSRSKRYARLMLCPVCLKSLGFEEHSPQGVQKTDWLLDMIVEQVQERLEEK